MTRIEQGLIQSSNGASGVLQQCCGELFRALPQIPDSLIIPTGIPQSTGTNSNDQRHTSRGGPCPRPRPDVEVLFRSLRL